MTEEELAKLELLILFTIVQWEAGKKGEEKLWNLLDEAIKKIRENLCPKSLEKKLVK